MAPKAVPKKSKSKGSRVAPAKASKPGGKKGVAKPKPSGRPVKKAVLPAKPRRPSARIRPARAARGAVEEVRRRPLRPTAPPPPPEHAPRLLPERKSTSAALSHLEKAIKLIYQKDFRKARQELKELAENYPAEKEILARAATFRQICDREESAHKRPVVTQDQLYSLGILEHNRGNYQGAVSYFLQSLEKHPQADYIYYSLAATSALQGDAAASVEYLRTAIRLNESNRIYAKNDSDFSSLYSDRDFTSLVGMSPQPTPETAA